MTASPRSRETHAPTARPEHAIVARGVRKSFGPVVALDGVDLSVRPGQVYGVLGPNGAGKTTFLRIALGLVRPDAGDLQVLGAPPGTPQTLRRIGAMIESPAFIPSLSGRTNLRILATARGLPAGEVDRVLALVDLTTAGARKVREYSLGMRQRLGVASALLGEPEVLILDEPTNGLDPDGVVAMRRLIRGRADAGASVLVSSHVLSEVEVIGDRAVILDRGRTVASGTMDELRAGGTRSLEDAFFAMTDREHLAKGA